MTKEARIAAGPNTSKLDRRTVVSYQLADEP
jgi:hypothetical protein